jgi:hypothetical protein
VLKRNVVDRILPLSEETWRRKDLISLAREACVQNLVIRCLGSARLSADCLRQFFLGVGSSYREDSSSKFFQNGWYTPTKLYGVTFSELQYLDIPVILLNFWILLSAEITGNYKIRICVVTLITPEIARRTFSRLVVIIWLSYKRTLVQLRRLFESQPRSVDRYSILFSKLSQKREEPSEHSRYSDLVRGWAFGGSEPGSGKMFYFFCITSRQDMGSPSHMFSGYRRCIPVMLTVNLLLTLSLRMSGTEPPLPLSALMIWIGTTFTNKRNHHYIYV